MFVALSVSVVLLAVFVRLYFVAVAQIEAPIRGDIIEYVNYAQSLLEHQTFSRDRVAGAPAPDSFRSPGYPVFLAIAMLLGQQQWYAWALGMQIALAGISVLLTLLLARQLVSRGWAIACALLAAVWPHHIVATATLLSEVLFGTVLLGALYVAIRASTARHTGAMTCAGVLFGIASLVNPVALLLPVVLGGVRLLRGQRQVGIALLVAGMLLPLAWAGRNALVVPETDVPGRLAMNFVQGSWPQYHRAHNTRLRHPVSQQIITAIDAEIVQLHASPMLGLQSMATRMAMDPGYHIAWYLWHKPYLLWAWDIRIGIGDIYYHRIAHSPLETHPLLAPIKRALRWLNPVFFALMVGFVAIVATGRDARQRAARIRAA